MQAKTLLTLHLYLVFGARSFIVTSRAETERELEVLSFSSDLKHFMLRVEILTALLNCHRNFNDRASDSANSKRSIAF